MPRKKKTNGVTKDKLSENDRLSTLVAREKHARCLAEVQKLEAQAQLIQQTLQQAQQNLADAVEEHREHFKRVQKTYGTDDATKYNLETGAITRAKEDATDAPS